ncbi:MAG TPA: nucleotidyl transferase AbiEii/AbiGii toxin family protein [Armatimonadota bacterium]|nr:nucleotidyl transferase AbiEii/AbiGii toxin family protein [Armatimonadota bacterium]
MLSADTLTFREFMVSEPLPLATLHNAVLDFLKGRDDVVLFGAQAVNAYVGEPRMTQVVDLLSIRDKEVAEALRTALQKQFHAAVRTGAVSQGRGYRLFQVSKTEDRRFADVRHVDWLPEAKRISGVLVIAPAALIASKVIAYQQRRGQPKSGTDWRDLAMLLLTFPQLRQNTGPVMDHLQAASASAEAVGAWHELVKAEIHPPDEDDGDW